jgi:hypothetical protein
MEVRMAEIRGTDVTKGGGFGGKAGNRKTLLLTALVSVTLLAAVAFYMLPQLW